MRKISAWFLVFAMLLTLCACQEQGNPQALASHPTAPTSSDSRPSDTPPTEATSPSVFPHRYSSAETKAATCTQTGLRTYTCDTCADTYTEVIPTIAHNYVDLVCTGCGAKLPGLTVNGNANAVILLSSNASTLEAYAAKELQDHIKLVSGAQIPVQSQNLPVTESAQLSIVIGTTDSFPELSSLYPKDIAYLNETVVSPTEIYGSDGFAIRQQGNTIYIFGTEPRGALNGVYDFIEENLGVLWLRANDTVYEEMETIPVTTVNYREKSPFAVRGWNTTGTGASGNATCDPATDRMFSRNKFNSKYVPTYANGNPHRVWNLQRPMGLETISMGHNVVKWLRCSSIFDPNETEYWNEDAEGNLFSDPANDTKQQVNFWSDKTVAVVAQGVIDFLDRYTGQLDNVGIGIGDTTDFQQYPEQTQPFEYEPGKFVQPDDPLYFSTVFFTFINRVAKIVEQKYPDVTINVMAYNWCEPAPLCDIASNIRILFAPAQEDITDPLNTAATSSNNSILQHLESWKQKTRNIVLYNYYGCFTPSKQYPRPIGDRIQADLQYYAANGFVGTLPEGTTDHGESADSWAMNSLTYWLYAKLSWNPYEDVDALIAEFCEKVYGDAANDMLQFYTLIEQAWKQANVNGFDIRYFYSLKWYLDTLNDTTKADLNAALNRAWALADDTAKERIRYLKNTFESVTA